MLSPEYDRTLGARALLRCVAGVNVRMEAPDGVLDVLEAMLSHVPHVPAQVEADVIITVTLRNDLYEIKSETGSFKVLGSHSALPQVAGAVVNSVVVEVAARRSCRTMRASVVERSGRALAFVGDDWESAITLAAHLHGRGWSYLGSDNVLLEPQTLVVLPIQKSLYVNSSAVVQLPIEYRRAVEASPWYVTPRGISFYAVDPLTAGYLQTWSMSAVLRGLIVVDGAMNALPSIESLDSRALAGERFTRLKIDWNRVTAVDLRLGNFVASCDLVEHWFESIGAPC